VRRLLEVEKIASVALAVAQAVTVVVAAGADDRPSLTIAVSLAVLLVAGTAVLRSGTPLLLPALLLLGGTFALLDGLGQIATPLAAPYALALFLTAELGYGVPRSDADVPLEARPERARRRYLAVVGGSSIVVFVVVLGLSGILEVGAAGEIVGLASAVAVVVLVVVATSYTGRQA
jgi:hypothetical protein